MSMRNELKLLLAFSLGLSLAIGCKDRNAEIQAENDIFYREMTTRFNHLLSSNDMPGLRAYCEERNYRCSPNDLNGVWAGNLLAPNSIPMITKVFNNTSDFEIKLCILNQMMLLDLPKNDAILNDLTKTVTKMKTRLSRVCPDREKNEPSCNAIDCSVKLIEKLSPEEAQRQFDAQQKKEQAEYDKASKIVISPNEVFQNCNMNGTDLTSSQQKENRKFYSGKNVSNWHLQLTDANSSYKMLYLGTPFICSNTINCQYYTISADGVSEPSRAKFQSYMANARKGQAILVKKARLSYVHLSGHFSLEDVEF